MNDLLTIQEIAARFAPDWVLIGDPETDESLEILAGRFFFTAQTRTRFVEKPSNIHQAVMPSGFWEPSRMTWS